jgi:hypothetical protein
MFKVLVQLVDGRRVEVDMNESDYARFVNDVHTGTGLFVKSKNFVLNRNHIMLVQRKKYVKA